MPATAWCVQENMDKSVLLVIKIEAWWVEMQVVVRADRSEDGEGLVC